MEAAALVADKPAAATETETDRYAESAEPAAAFQAVDRVLAEDEEVTPKPQATAVQAETD